MASKVPPLVSVISLTCNRKERIEALLQALRGQDYRPFEVIVVDNASTDGTPFLIRSRFPEVRLVEAQGNLGTYSYNLGVKAARGKYFLMMDDDGLPARCDWITQVVSRFEANPRLGVVACTVRMQDTGRLAPDSPQFIPESNGDLGYSCAAYNGTGAGLRAAAVQTVGALYPKWFFRSYIELHLCTRLLHAGWEVRHFPELEVWHCRPSGTSNPPLGYYGLRNYYWYVWTLYPWPYVVTETLHELGSRAKLTVQGKIPLSRFMTVLRDAFLGMPVAIRERHPVSRSTVDHLRFIRRHGNWHGIAPEVVQFPFSTEV